MAELPNDYCAWDAPLAEYEAQACQLLAGHAAGVPLALKVFHECHPRFLDEKVTWLPKPLSEDDIRGAALTDDDARLALARMYGFRDWGALEVLVNAVQIADSPVREFEQAVNAVITGNTALLREMLTTNPDLVRARSTRITCNDPQTHQATLLHYLGANGVENYRQKSPANAVDVATLLLDAGAGTDALANMYGGECTTLSMLVSSTPPADAGVQVALTHTLLDYGANVEGAGRGAWTSPLMTALVFGFRDVANALVVRGALVDTLVKAAGIGDGNATEKLLPNATALERHQALAMAVIMENVAIVQTLLETGVDPSAYNPAGFHAHGTPLHHAALAGNLPLVKLLIGFGARIDICDTLWNGTPFGWAEHAGQTDVMAYLSEFSTGPTHGD